MNTGVNMFKYAGFYWIFPLFLMGWTTQSQAATFYVKSGAPAGGNGSSWAKAFNNLDAALSAARASSVADQIWVAAGTYTPTIKYVAYSLTPPAASTYTGTEASLVTFNLPSNVAIYGGFAG